MNVYSGSNLNPSPPYISLTPSNLSGDSNQQHQQHQQQHQHTHSRHRAGTLPSSFLNNHHHPNSSQSQSQSQSNNIPIKTTSLSSSTSPLIAGQHHNTEGLTLPSMDTFSLGVSSNAIDIPHSSHAASSTSSNKFLNSSSGGLSHSASHGHSHSLSHSHNGSFQPSSSASSSNIGAGGPRRMRSGSLFSTNSIWNDDTFTSHSPVHVGSNILESTLENNTSSLSLNNNNNSTPLATNNASSSNVNNSNNSFLSPILSAQTHLSPATPANDLTTSNRVSTPNAQAPSNTQRTRSYTTTAAIPNPVSSGPYGILESSQAGGRFSGSPFLTASSNKTNDMNSLLDNLIVNMNSNSPTTGASNTPNNATIPTNDVSSHNITLNGDNNDTPDVATASTLNNSDLNNPISSRNRSQTYSGATPTISEATINPHRHLLSQAYLQQATGNSYKQQHQQQYQQHQQQQHQQQQQFQSQQNHQQLQNNLQSSSINQNFGNLVSSSLSASQPMLDDDFDYRQYVITTNFESPNLGPTEFLLFDNLPQFIDSVKLWSILNNSLDHNRSLGNILSVRVTRTNTSQLALVECVSIEVAMSLKASFNHLELVPGVTLYVAFAKVADMPKNSTISSGHKLSNNNNAPNKTVPESASVAGSANTGTTNNTPPKSNGSNNSTASTNGQSSNQNSNHNNNNNSNFGGNGVHALENLKPVPTDLLAIQKSLMESIKTLGNSTKQSDSNTSIDLNKVVSIINKSIAYPNKNYQDNFGPLPDPIPLRQFDSPKLRELRKILENNEALLSGVSRSGSMSPQPKKAENVQKNNEESQANSSPDDGNMSDSEDSDLSNKTFSQLELEELCLAMLDELPELCYDYLGNTIVQKVFTVLESKLIKLMMVKEIAPFLTQLSIHKNGTWAIQKIINLCNSNSVISGDDSDDDFQQKYLIGASLKPYAVKLFNDQFGNYVLQGCIKFGSPFNDFIFEAMLDNFVEISSGRFGARCIRTILETANDNNAITNEQVLLVAGLIVEYANELVVNNNGSLLITWFLDTFNGCGATIDDRFELLTQKFLPSLTKLCTHKLANLTILKIINNRADLRPKQLIMDAIFGKFDSESDESTFKPPSKLLESILMENNENAAGPLFIYKVISNSLLLTIPGENGNDANKNARYQQYIVQQVKRILLEISINNFQPYKKLMDEVGLSSNRLNRTSSMNNRRNRRNNNHSKSKSAGVPQGMMPQNLYNQINYMGMGGMHQGTPGNPLVPSGYGGGSTVQPNVYGIPQQQFQPQLNPSGSNASNAYGAFTNMMGQPGQMMIPAQGPIPPQVANGPMGPYDMAAGAQMMAAQQRGMVVPPHFQQQRQQPNFHNPQPIQGGSMMGRPQSQDFQHSQDMAVMQQLEQLSLSSAALGYNSNPGTPAVTPSQRNSFFG